MLVYKNVEVYIEHMNHKKMCEFSSSFRASLHSLAILPNKTFYELAISTRLELPLPI
jgi:hypothetical protein